MRDYEMVVVVSPQGGDDGFPTVLAHVDQLIVNQGGSVAQTMTNPPWGHRKLAYPIRDFRDAYFAVVHLQLEPSRLVALERELQLADQILRFLVVRRDEAMRAEVKAAARRPIVPPTDPDADEAEGNDDGDARSE